jgi:hypothetical protein
MPGRRQTPGSKHFSREEIAINGWDEEDLRVAEEIVDVSVAFGTAMFVTVNATLEQKPMADEAWKQFGRRLVAAMEDGKL